MRMMSTFTILTLGLLSVMAAPSLAQRITLTKQKASLEQVFSELRLQSGYDFTYRKELLKNALPVTISVKDLSLAEVLNKLMEGQNLSYELSDEEKLVVVKEKTVTDKIKDFFITGGRATDEERGVTSHDGKVISGRVTDSLGNPLANATVRIKGTSRATFTDKNGEFTLRGIKDDATLQISFLGFTTREVPVSDHLTTIVLQRAEASLDEVDVVSNGYQVLSKERGTAAFDKIGQKLLERKISSDIISRIENLTPGVYFDKKYSENFTVRGISTLTSQIATPLIILDNFPYDGDIKNINPNDIQSITILKDGAATSIWGARAGNGVIVITSKKGQYQEKSKISASSSVNLTEKPDLFAAKQMSTSDYINVEKFLFDNGAYDDALTNTTRYPIVSPVVEILDKQKRGILSSDDAITQIDAFRDIDVRHDYLKYLYRTNVDQQYALNLSGGDKAINYYVSAGYDKGLASLVGNQSERFTFRNQTTYKPISQLDLSLSLQYTNTKTQNNSIGSSVTQLRNYNRSALYPYVQLKDANGNNAYIAKDYRSSFTDTAGNGKLLDWRYNPLNELANNDNTSSNADWVANFTANYKLTHYLSIEGKYQYESALNIGNDLQNQNSYFTRNLINQFTQINADGNATYPIPLGSILDRSTGRISSHSFRTQFNFDKQIGAGQLVAIAGFELKQLKSDYNADRLYGYSKSTLAYTPNLDYITYFQSYDNLNFGNQIPNPSTLEQLLNRYVSYYGNASYNINSKYILSGSLRRDESNLFGVKTNQKGVPLWSAGGSWILSKEGFYHSDLFSYIKLRYTFGRSGNVNNSLSALPTIEYLNSGSGRFTNLPFAVVNSYANPELRWERVSMHNIGLDFGTRSESFSGYVEYYIKNSKDLISAAPADPTSGTILLTTNNAALKGHGFDITLNSKIINRQFNWYATINFSYNKTIVSKYLVVPTFPAGYVGGGDISPNVGSNIYNIVAYKWAGLDSSNGDPRGYFQGKVSKEYSSIINSGTWPDLVTVGPTIPQYFGSIRNNFAYKAFALSINITYKFDYFLRKTSLNYTSIFNGGAGHSDYSLRWQQPGDEFKISVPSMVYPADNYRDDFYANSEVNVIKGDNIRIADCNLSFQLNNRWAKIISFSSLQIYSYINNIGIIWKANKFGIDPDTPDGVRNQRSFGLGLRASL